MKRNSITKKIISLFLSLLVLSSCFACLSIDAIATVTSTTREAGFPRKEDPYYRNAGFGTIAGTEDNPIYCASGNALTGSHANSLFFLNGYEEIAYCIEMGVPVNNGASITTTDELEACEKLVKNLQSEKNVTKVSMTRERMQTLLRSVLGYGYHHDGSNMTQWTNIVNDPYQRENYSYAYATQTLVRELVSGERDSNFDLVDVPNEVNGRRYLSIYEHSIKPNNPLKAVIDKYYNQIVNDVKNSTPTLDPNIKDATFTMQPNEENQTLEAVIPDKNGLFAETTAIPGLVGAAIKHENGQLTITVPYRYAKEGSYALNYNIRHKEPERIHIYLPTNSQDMVAATGKLLDVNESGSLTLVIPHHHEWVPHVIIPTCTTEGLTCMLCNCGNIYTESTQPPLDHDYTNSAWVIGYPATCSEDGELVQICERCNTVVDSKPIPKTGHEGVWVIETEATADHEGQMVLHCIKCGNRTETKSFESHMHEYGYEAVVREATCVTDGLMGEFCSLCGVCYDTSTIAAGHSDSFTWVTTKQPTCTVAGEASAFCNDCGVVVATESVEATGHASGIWLTNVAPFCGLEGEEICICDQCGETIDSRTIDALTHEAGVWMISKYPTCEIAGEKVKNCTRCGHIIETETIEAIGHDEGVWRIDIEADADVDGIMGRYCTRCFMVLETKDFTLHSHEEGYQVTLLQATCTRDGEKGTACKICNAVFSSELIPALQHEYSDFYTRNNGTHSKSCSRCHYVYTENCEYEVAEDVAATCISSGYKTSICAVCSHSYTDSFVPPYGHTFGKWTSEGKSTHMRYCVDCGVMEISKHVWGEYFSNNDGDIIEEGSKTCSCIYCGESKTIGKPASIIKSAFKVTIGALEMIIAILEVLREYMALLTQFLELVSMIKMF